MATQTLQRWFCGAAEPPSPEAASTVTKGTFPLLSAFVSIDLLSGEQWDPRFDNKVKDLYYDDNHSGFSSFTCLSKFSYNVAVLLI